eukprot:TRINITY_DN11236_c0_g1_i1.p1 TRINITY_DN11236_c0_g1~~TRINITY_DN11236_c0_g1_i1.p1  ORF type:complete len:565 (+),score=113.27 TRINITY_DN11236_c0_g1_i1:70-1764(+)
MPTRRVSPLTNDLFAPLPSLQGNPEGDPVTSRPSGGSSGTLPSYHSGESEEAHAIASSCAVSAATLRSPSQLRVFAEHFDAAMEVYNSIAAGHRGAQLPSDAGGAPPAARSPQLLEAELPCIHCAAPTAVRDRFCRECGKVLRQSPLSASGPAATDAPAPQRVGAEVFRGGEFPSAAAATHRSSRHTSSSAATEPRPRGWGTPQAPPVSPPVSPNQLPDSDAAMRLAEATLSGAQGGYTQNTNLPSTGSAPPQPPGEFDVAVVRMLMQERERLSRDMQHFGAARSRIEREKQLLQEEMLHIEAAQRGKVPAGRRASEGGWGRPSAAGLPPPHLMPTPYAAQQRRGGDAAAAPDGRGTRRRLYKGQASAKLRSRSAPTERAARRWLDSSGMLSDGSSAAIGSAPAASGHRPLLGTPQKADLNTSGTTAGRRSKMSMKEQIRESNRVDTALRSGYFQAEDLRGASSFPRTPRFNDIGGVREPGMAFYFLDDAVEEDIRLARKRRRAARTRSASQGRREQHSSLRGNIHCNVTSRWGICSGLGGGHSPGPGAYDPRFAKVMVRSTIV